MPITVVDLDSPDTFGEFGTPQEAHASAVRSGLKNYELWEGSEMLERVGVRPKRTMIDKESDTDLEF